jgi:hypothetical protein
MEEFVKKIKTCWKPYDSSSMPYILIQFQKNMKEAKKVAANGLRKKNKNTKSS